MKYILDSNGYVESASCNPISCDDKVSQDYTGSIPSGYDSLDDWILNANIRAYKITSGNLVYDSARDEQLQALWEQTNGYGAAVGKASKNTLIPYNKHSNSASYDYSNDTYKLTSSGAIYLLCKVITGNTYTLSYKNNNGFASIRANDYNNGSWIEYGRATTTNGSITFKANTDTVVIQFVGGTANSSTIQNVQLELGLTATEYEEYYPPIVAAVDSNGGIHKIAEPQTTTNLTMASGFTLDGSNFSKKPILEKQSKIVHLAILVNAANNFPDSATTIATLPAGYRPTYTQVFACGLGGTSNAWYIDGIGYVAIESSGKINVRNSTGSTKKYAFINVTFFTD